MRYKTSMPGPSVIAVRARISEETPRDLRGVDLLRDLARMRQKTLAQAVVDREERKRQRPQEPPQELERRRGIPLNP